jgi:hypothetical protein
VILKGIGASGESDSGPFQLIEDIVFRLKARMMIKKKLMIIFDFLRDRALLLSISSVHYPLPVAYPFE